MAGELLIFLAFAALFVAFFVFLYRREKKRSEEMQKVAAQLGLQYAKRGDRQLLANVGFLAAMPRGQSRHVRNVLWGDYRGLRVWVLEYVFTTGSGKNKQTHHHEVAWAYLPGEFPGLTIVPENFGHKLLDALGGDDIDFESDEFSRKFWVRSSDRKFAYDIVHGRMMEHIMSPGLDRWELKGPYLVAWAQRTRLDPHEIQPDLDRLAGFYDLIPSFRKPAASAASAGNR